jgi:four helix bundle protein
MYTYYFEKLEVWQNSRSLIKAIYQTTSLFPKEETFGLTNQIRRAGLSIAANIAEGLSRKTDKDKAKFINQSYSSTWEVISFLIISADLDYINEAQYKDLRERTSQITNQLNSLYNAITSTPKKAT